MEKVTLSKGFQKIEVEVDRETAEMINKEDISEISSCASVNTSVPSVLNDGNILKSKVLSGKPKKQIEDLQERKERAIKEMNYLLKNSQKYSSYILKKLTAGAPTIKRKPLVEVRLVESEIKKLKDKQVEGSSIDINGNLPSDIAELKYFTGSLHPYQKEGVKWMKILFENSINGILADEMGLGKTVQVIALICNLVENKVRGPYLIVGPLATLPNWVAEFKRFAPQIPVVLFYGTKEERAAQKYEIRKMFKVDQFTTPPVVITSYQYPVREQRYLQQFRWQYLVIDEGHRIKNFKCQLISSLKQLVSANRLILTGTPLQNNLLELWSLLNFLLPQIFPNADTFAALFEVQDFEQTDKIIEQEQNTNIISTIHGVLGPFMLRRLKSDVLQDLVPKKEVLVYCPLTDFQRDLYKYVLQRNLSKLTGKTQEPEEDETITSKTLTQARKKRKCTMKNVKYEDTDSDEEFEEFDPKLLNNNNGYFKTISNKGKKNIVYNVKMQNPVMIMKKIVNHPFTVHIPVNEVTREVVIDEEIVKQSGKMMVLDAMLAKLKERGHKVLIFCTMTQILDFIEDYMYLRDYQYCRLDGRSKGLKERQDSIDAFNSNRDIFVFLISTRAGGLGINLTEADTVILYDRDWNPQVDIQAQDRCHRIGQKKPVMVYSFITKGTIDETIVTRANAKRRLEKIVIKKGKFTSPEDTLKSVLDIKELEELLKSVDHNHIMQTNGAVFTDEELNSLLDRSELYKEMENKKISKENYEP